jgi:hypothetical protein
MTMISIRISITIASLFMGLPAFASAVKPSFAKLPPLGKRVYILEASEPTGPTAIQVDSHQTVQVPYMKDPNIPGAVVRKPAVFVPKARAIAAKPATLNFKKMKIVGNFSYPRVGFDDEKATVQRADEPLGQDFFGKIFADADRDL